MLFRSYASEIVVCPKKERIRKNTKNQPQLDVLDLGEVEIRVYDFQLTNDGHVRKKTIDILFEKASSYATHFVGASSSRLTRVQMEGPLVLLMDKDNVIVDVEISEHALIE